MTETLPPEVTFTNFSTTNGWTCSDRPARDVSRRRQRHGRRLVGADHDPRAREDTARRSDREHRVGRSRDRRHLACSDPSTCEHETLAASRQQHRVRKSSSIGSTGFDLAISSIIDVPDPVAPAQALKYRSSWSTEGRRRRPTSTSTWIHTPTAGEDFVSADGSNGFNCGDSVVQRDRLRRHYAGRRQHDDQRELHDAPLGASPAGRQPDGEDRSRACVRRDERRQQRYDANDDDLRQRRVHRLRRSGRGALIVAPDPILSTAPPRR